MESTSHIEMVVFCPDGKLSWPGDEQLLKQVLVNLLQNSVQALENRQNAKIEVRARLNASSKLEICVKDNGPGIAAEILEIGRAHV